VIVRARAMRAELPSRRARSTSVGHSQLLSRLPIPRVIGIARAFLKVRNARNEQLLAERLA
jgi:hypothetical protein